MRVEYQEHRVPVVILTFQLLAGEPRRTHTTEGNDNDFSYVLMLLIMLVNLILMTTFENFIAEDQIPQHREKKIGSYLICNSVSI